MLPSRDTAARSAHQRERMVAEQLEARGLANPRVLDAVRAVPRELFVPPRLRRQAYADRPLPLGDGQTISQPYIVAHMIALVEPQPSERVLEIGTGSGYSTAILSRLAARVYSVERIDWLAEQAAQRLRTLAVSNVHILVGDGTDGWPDHAPYDVILAWAGGPIVPGALREQLAPGGRLIMPVGQTPRRQELVRVRRVDDGAAEKQFEEERLGRVAFVPLIGRGGWKSD